jgi:hypothetical protein
MLETSDASFENVILRISYVWSLFKWGKVQKIYILCENIKDGRCFNKHMLC